MQCVDDKCIPFISLFLACPNKNIILKRKRGYPYESENCSFSLSTEVCCNKYVFLFQNTGMYGCSERIKTGTKK